MKTNNNRGFMLMGIFIAIVVLGILAAAIAPAIQASLEAAEILAERQTLAGLKTDIERSFEETDMSRNISALSGGTGIGSNSTVFQTATTLNTAIDSSATVTASDWQQKVARLRNQTATVGATLDATTGGPSTIWFNSRQWERVLIAGPSNEASQRFLLISMLTPASRELTFPTSGSVFDEIWANSWEGGASSAPSAWSSRITAAAYQEWNETVVSRTNASRFLVQRINQMKYDLTLVNSHPSDSVWVDVGTFNNAMTLGAAGGVLRSNTLTEFAQGIPSGRQVVVRRGTTSATAVEVQRFRLNAPVTITVQ